MRALEIWDTFYMALTEDESRSAIHYMLGMLMADLTEDEMQAKIEDVKKLLGEGGE